MREFQKDIQALTDAFGVGFLIEQFGLEDTAEAFAIDISETLKTRELVYQFVLEELDAARRGGEKARKFVAESGIPRIDYEGAMGRSCPEIDGAGGPQQRLCAADYSLGPDHALQFAFRTTVVMKLMKMYRIGQFQYKTTGLNVDSSADHLVQVVKKVDDPDNGLFVNIMNDLAHYAGGVGQGDTPIRLMAYAYARRTAAAGLFLQGVIGKDDLTYQLGIFIAFQHSTGQTKEFQVEAYEQALELLQSYNGRLTKDTVARLVAAASTYTEISPAKQRFRLTAEEVLDMLSSSEGGADCIPF